ncbi:HYR domain-containing protein [Bacillus sp. NTK034]|uniref:RCC1 domain-containing protein n=1 Tax=Bacillus sp. NTK034 TaxID=2802176 RepID=UPI001A8FD50C|nr:HYR domain-containing protein [Bacillus sp. NTK034]MBN8203935.1 HYR domain-containing protein [Bacillus sp. NTK034]
MSRTLAWGDNNFGQLGIGRFGGSRAIPVPVRNLDSAIAVSGRGNHSLALLADGTIRAWGSNDFGPLGDGSNTSRNVPVRVRGISDAVAISAGEQHSLALLADGTIRAWGRNLEGQLGNGTNINSNIPVRVNGITNARMIAAGNDHSLALRRDGGLEAWGSNDRGQLGDESTINSNTPVEIIVPVPSDLIAIAAGRVHSLALRANGTGLAWGGNEDGQLGTGDNVDQVVPAEIDDLDDAVAIAAGRDHSVALRSDGRIMAWGRNVEGQLGNGSNINRNTPIFVIGISDAVAIAAGDNHSLSILSDGTSRTWGDNSFGQLGDGTTGGTSNVPVQVSGIENVLEISGGRAHSLAIQFSCPPDISVFNDPGQRGAFVNYTQPIANPGDFIVCNPAPGSFFPLGSTTVTCTITQPSGITRNCLFNVRVIMDPCRFLSNRCFR